MKKAILILIIFFIHFSGNAQRSPQNNFSENTISDVKIYPNPCKEEKVTIEFINQEIREIRLINIIGKEVFFKQYPYSENKKQIELTEVPNGIYIIKIVTSDNAVSVKKLVVSRQ